jgi:molybdopterin converting factor small subunit
VVFELAGPLRQHAGGADAVEVDVPDGASVTDALDALAKAHPAVERRVRDDEGRLRPHVNLFAGGDLIRGAENTTALRQGQRLVVLPAVSGGSGALGSGAQKA